MGHEARNIRTTKETGAKYVIAVIAKRQPLRFPDHNDRMRADCPITLTIQSEHFDESESAHFESFVDHSSNRAWRS